MIRYGFFRLYYLPLFCLNIKQTAHVLGTYTLINKSYHSLHFLHPLTLNIQEVVVDRSATKNFRFDKPAKNMDNFPQNSLFWF